MNRRYHGRLAPTPTGFLHAGHAATFWTVFERARAGGGRLTLRIEDLDPLRCKPEFATAAIEDLAWLGITWTDGPVFQSARREVFLAAWRRLRDGGFIYPCHRSRRDVQAAPLAPHGEEALFPAAWRGDVRDAARWDSPAGINWRFQVPDGRTVSFCDERLGTVSRTAARDFGDFLIWNRDNIPAYELAVVADDIDQQITEVVRGEDLLTSTARQLLVYEALGARPPAFFHCPLVCDANGRRLAKRDQALSLRTLRAQGLTPRDVLSQSAPTPRNTPCE